MTKVSYYANSTLDVSMEKNFQGLNFDNFESTFQKSLNPGNRMFLKDDGPSQNQQIGETSVKKYWCHKV